MTIPDSGYMMENGSIELPCTPEEEARIIQELISKAESNLREGNTYYVISNRFLIPTLLFFYLLLFAIDALTRHAGSFQFVYFFFFLNMKKIMIICLCESVVMLLILPTHIYQLTCASAY